MKKKIATLLLAFAIFLPCVFFFTACDNEGSQDNAKVTGVSVELASSTGYELVDNTITIEYGAKVEIDSSDIIVNAVFDDGTTKLITPKTETEEGYTFASTIPADSITPIGEYSITISYKDLADYVIDVDVVKANIDMTGVTWDYDSQNPFVYDGQPKMVQLINLPAGVEVEYQNNSNIATNAGTHTAVAIFTIDSEHYNAISNKTLDWTISKADIDVSNVELKTDTFTFNNANHTVEVDTTTLPTGVIATITGEKQATDVGTYNITVLFEYTGADKANYNDIPSWSTSWTIEPGVYTTSGVSFKNTYNLTYNGTAQLSTLTANDILVGDDAVEIVSFSGHNQINAGTHYVNVKLNYIGSDPNYNRVSDVVLSYTIAPAALTITAKDAEIVYGESAINNGVTYQGFVNGENESVLVGTLKYKYGEYQVGSDNGTYTISLEDNCVTASNYDITFATGDLVVAKREIVVKSRDITTDYNTLPDIPGLDVTNLASCDTVDDLGSPAYNYGGYTLGSDVGTYDITVSGLANDNYIIKYEGVGVLTINKIDIPSAIVEAIDSIALKNNALTYTGEKLAVEIDETTVPEGIVVESVVNKNDAESIVVGDYVAVVQSN